MPYTTRGIGYEPTFEINEFEEPKINSELETLKNALLFVLFSKPGSYPSIPQIGMDLESRLYSFYDEIDETNLKTEITEQCQLLGIYINNGTIMVKKLVYKNQPSLIIHIEGRDSYPDGYKHADTDQVNHDAQFLIGITYDQLNQMLLSVNRGVSSE